MQRLENPKMSIVFCCAPLQYIWNRIPLDNPKNHTALSYITMAYMDDLRLFLKFISAIEFTVTSHALLKQKTVTRRKIQPWFDKEALILKTKCRNTERRWIKTKTKHD